MTVEKNKMFNKINEIMASPGGTVAGSAIDSMMTFAVPGITDMFRSMRGENKQNAHTYLHEGVNQILAMGADDLTSDMVEVERGEVIEHPDGTLTEEGGNTHAQGGNIKQVLPAGVSPMKDSDAVEQGAKVYSTKLKRGGKTMAERKKKRESRLKKLLKQERENPGDVAAMNTRKRMEENLAREEERDLALQSLYGKIAKMFEEDPPPGVQMAMGGPVKDKSYQLGSDEEGIAITEPSKFYQSQMPKELQTAHAAWRPGYWKSYDTLKKKYENPDGSMDYDSWFADPEYQQFKDVQGDVYLNTEGGIPKHGPFILGKATGHRYPESPEGFAFEPLMGPEYDESLDAPSFNPPYEAPAIGDKGFTGPIPMTDEEMLESTGFMGMFDAARTESLGLPGEEEKKKDPEDPFGPEFTPGDIMGMKALRRSGMMPLATTLLNRVMTTPTRNFFANYGKQAISTAKGAKDNIKKVADLERQDVVQKAEGARSRVRESARSLGVRRAMDLAISKMEGDQNRKISATEMEQIANMDTRIATMQMRQDAVVSEGEKMAFDENEQMVDNFFTNLNKDLGNLSTKQQEQAKALNQAWTRKFFLKMVPEMNAHGFSVDMYGNMFALDNGDEIDDSEARDHITTTDDDKE